MTQKDETNLNRTTDPRNTIKRARRGRTHPEKPLVKDHCSDLESKRKSMNQLQIRHKIENEHLKRAIQDYTSQQVMDCTCDSLFTPWINMREKVLTHLDRFNKRTSDKSAIEKWNTRTITYVQERIRQYLFLQYNQSTVFLQFHKQLMKLR